MLIQELTMHILEQYIIRQYHYPFIMQTLMEMSIITILPIVIMTQLPIQQVQLFTSLIVGIK